MRTSFIVESVLSGLRRNLTMTIALILGTGITLTFVGAAFLSSTEISRFTSTYEGKLNVSVFVCAPITDSPNCPSHAVLDDQGKQVVTGGQPQTTRAASASQVSALRSKLTADPAVSSVSYVNAQQQYDRAKRTLTAETTKSLQVGDIPPSFTVKLNDIKSDYKPFLARFAAVSGVGEIDDQNTVISTLLNIIDGFRLLSVLVAAVVLVASVLLIANTIQVAAQQRRNETSIMRLVGASRWMTEAPFLLETVIATIIGGLVATGMVFLGKYFVLNNIFGTQTQNHVIPDLGSNDILIACGEGLLAGIVVAALTAFATLRLYVKL